MKKNKKLDNLLKNNTFLINYSICLVLVLTMCYFGQDYITKKTYSANIYSTVGECNSECNGECIIIEDGFLCENPKTSTTTSIIGEYRWKDVLTQYNGTPNSGGVLFDLNTKFSSDSINFNEIVYIYGGGEHHLIYQYKENGSAIHSVTLDVGSNGEIRFRTSSPDTLSVDFDSLKTINFTEEFTIADSNASKWFVENLQAVNKCYYSTTEKKYIWNNLPSTGILVSDITTKSACESNTTKLQSIIGEYRWNNVLTQYNGTPNSAGVLFDLNTKFSSDSINFNEIVYIYGGGEHHLIYQYNENGSAVHSVTLDVGSNGEIRFRTSYPDTLSVDFDSLKTINFTEELFFGYNNTYNWFTENLTPVNKCYYNQTQKKYIWTNVPSSGELFEEYSTNSACETRNNIYIIKYYKDGEIIDTIEVQKNEDTILPSVSKDGYEFNGWYTSATGGTKVGKSGESYTPENDINLYAQWIKPYEISSTYKIDTTKKNITFNIGTLKTKFEEDVTMGEEYQIVIDSKIVNNKESLYTGAKIKILKPDNTIYDEYTAIVLGDLNGDGYIGTTDYVRIYNSWVEDNELSSIEEAAADFNEDDSVSTGDYIMIYNHLIEEN